MDTPLARLLAVIEQRLTRERRERERMRAAYLRMTEQEGKQEPGRTVVYEQFEE